MSDRKYLSCAETAKLIRKALRDSFPGVKFSVRSHTYAGGASIDVDWTDGPSQESVDEVAGQFHGATFDGMIDMKTYREHWILPSGEIRIAHDPGTECSRGMHPEIKGPGLEFGEITGAQRVSFGADFVFCKRLLSAEVLGQLEDIVRARGDELQWGRWGLAIDGRYHEYGGIDEACRALAEYHAGAADRALTGAVS